jgi:hypothetical protein
MLSDMQDLITGKNLLVFVLVIIIIYLYQKKSNKQENMKSTGNKDKLANDLTDDIIDIIKKNSFPCSSQSHEIKVENVTGDFNLNMADQTQKVSPDINCVKISQIKNKIKESIKKKIN